ncbi:restriction endonuclease subunit S [Chryseobacterium cucumeris]|uniref:restriction endonuclease subunit S n=1 Tax=Chryseobacterium cucumeris TaxID=1813611 RepID=UPI00192D708A|nr:restriction endonuclease subunit S [Chryseobacterium cucumeris]QRA41858.1 restriction endonuclease subunit S [Chryseobacterium cucumeris]
MKKLEDIVKNISSGKSKNSTSQGKYPFFGSTGVISYSNQSDYSGDKILIARVGANAGFIYKVKGSYAVSDNTLIVDIKNEKVLDFIFYYLSKFNLNKLIFGSGQPLITGGQLKSIRITLPSIEEQNKISTFFPLIDNRIQTQKKIIEKLETLMNTSREKIFSQKLRFKDEHGNYFPKWKLNKLGNLGMFFSGGTPLTSNRKYYQGNIPFIKSGEINSVETEQFISEDALKNSSAKMVNVGDILYALYGATSGEAGISKLNGAINQAILCIRTELDNLFLLNYLKFKKQNILSTYLQGGQGNLSSEIIKSLLIPIPDSNEQVKIANFLSSIQEKIETEKQILEKLELQKKFLLSNLFI